MDLPSRGDADLLVGRQEAQEAEDPEALARRQGVRVGERRLLDTSSWRVRRVYAEAMKRRLDARAGLLRRAGVDEIALTSGASAIGALLGFFRMREGRR